MFELICLSHSIMYKRRLPVLLQQIKNLLHPGGTLFIAAPDFSRNPYTLLLGDQFHYYTAKLLAKLFSHAGILLEETTTKVFPREALLFGGFGDTNVPPSGAEQVETALVKLASIESNLAELAHGEPLAVLGTSVNAAFVDGKLGDRLQSFVDENEDACGKEFRGKKVIHPSELSESTSVIVPYEKSSESINEKLSLKYSGKFVSLQSSV